MVDFYWRQIDDMKNDLENSIQISAILLKLKEQDAKIKDIEANKDIIKSNKTKIDNFTQYILKDNNDFEDSYNIEKQIFRFNKNKHFYTILKKTINYDFLLLIVCYLLKIIFFINMMIY